MSDLELIVHSRHALNKHIAGAVYGIFKPNGILTAL